MKKQFLLLTVLLFLLGACAPKPAEHSFIKVNADGQFVRDGKPYYFVGTNFWYGAILGSEGEGGNRERLHKELDFLKSIGINNLRVLVGADGENGIKTRVEPSLQVAPGVYNDTILAGLDYFMNELRERDMTAVLYLNNSWEWSGGYSVYLQWSGHGDAVVPAVDGWPAYMEYVKQFPQSDSAKALFANHVNYIVSRTNRYNQIKYVDDPTIMSWQIGNEPRAFSDENKEPFAGCNFWAWGGFAGQNPDHVFWEKGDDYTGDPAQEQQGLNSVFATDSTIEIIKAENRKLQN